MHSMTYNIPYIDILIYNTDTGILKLQVHRPQEEGETLKQKVYLGRTFEWTWWIREDFCKK